MRHRLLPVALAAVLVGWEVGPAGATAAGCLRGSGVAAARCLREYVGVVEQCRRTGSEACVTSAHAAAGLLPRLLSAAEGQGRGACTAGEAEALGYLDLPDLGARIPEACRDVAEDLLAATWGPPPPASAVACRRQVVRRLGRLEATIVRDLGAECLVDVVAGRACDRARRDGRVERARDQAVRGIVAGCGPEFDGLGLTAGPSLEARVGAVVDVVVDRARHFAERTYPAPVLGPTGEPGPYPVGVRTIDLVDASRLAVGGSGPRPVRLEIWYPSTPGAVTGVPRDVVQVLGVNVSRTTSFRDVDRAPGRLPVVLFSHGSGGIRFQSVFLAQHLASHGFLVASPDHHGNTFVDALRGVVDAQAAVNRPLDMHFVLDHLLAFDGEPGNFLAGAVDGDRVGMAGHSFGGYTAFALAGGAFGLGTFTDPRVKAILPQAPFSGPFDDAFFAGITIPTLVLGGSLDTTTPFAAHQERPFEHLPSGASVVGLAELVAAGHFTFSDVCEVPRNLVGLIGGFDEACEPRHLPWRWAHRIVNYLALNFFAATLEGDAAARARLAPAALAAVDDLVYRTK
ncbi:MAG: hypothetical protein U0807_02000 [Candidatus Binatia bacterium]